MTEDEFADRIRLEMLVSSKMSMSAEEIERYNKYKEEDELDKRDAEELQNILNDEDIETAHYCSVDYIKDKLKELDELDFYIWFDIMFNELSNYHKWLLLSFIMGSDIDVFSLWYSKALYDCTQSDDVVLKSRTEEMYNYYKNKFDEILKEELKNE